MIRPASTALVLLAVLCAASPALARKHAHAAHQDDSDASSDSADKKKGAKDKTDKKDKAESGKPTQLGTFGDWAAYVAKGKSKTCYTLASPKERRPDAKRGASYVFIADRPAEKVHNEVSIIMGTPLKEDAPAQAKVGNTAFDLVAKGANAWVKNTADEAKFVDALRHSAKLVVKAPQKKGPPITDTYALSGFGQALDRVGKECKAPAKK